MDRYLVISSDCHAGLPPERYRDYLDPQYREAYDADVARLRRVTDLDIAGFIGYWQPQGGLSRIGSKPTLGGLVLRANETLRLPRFHVAVTAPSLPAT